MRRRFTFFVLFVWAFALPLAFLTRRAPIIAQDHRAAKLPAHASAKRELQGTASCSASACHGGNDIGKPLSEATTWRAFDPHARAFDTLVTAQSQAIANRLWGDKTPAHDAPLCLKCHVHPDYEHARPNFRKQDGVGCESCHGAAQDWLTPHYRARWKQIDQERLGFANTKSLRGRAEICVRCHVGTPAAEVDHDLIAAGHPALRFEFATYFANLPPHWDVLKDKSRNVNPADKCVDFELRAWATGQSVAQTAFMDLLADRADPANGKAWPEFAYLECFSCHHDLPDGNWRRTKEYLQKRRPGALAWSEWYMPRHAVELARLFEKPGRADIAKAARKMVKFGDARRPLFHDDAPDLCAGLLRIVNDKDGRAARNWDEATQHYLLLLAVRQFHEDNKQPANADLERRIAELREQVTFPSGFGSPRGFVPPALRMLEKKK